MARKLERHCETERSVSGVRRTLLEEGGCQTWMGQTSTIKKCDESHNPNKSSTQKTIGTSMT